MHHLPSVDQLVRLLDAIGAPIYAVECRGERLEHVAFNRYCESMLELSPAQVIGHTAAEFLPAEAAALVEDHYRQCIASRQVLETELRLDLGKGERWIRTVKTPVMDAGGHVVRLLVQVQDITEEKRQRERYDYQSLLLSIQQETSPDGIVIVTGNPSHPYSWNQRFLELWGISEEAMGQGRDVVLPLLLKQLVEPESFRQRVEALDYSSEAVTQGEKLYFTDGRVFEYYSRPLICSQGLYRGRVWVFRDITERMQAELELRESEERYRKLFAFMDEGFVLCEVVHEQGRAVDILYVDANPAAVRLAGTELVGRYASQIEKPLEPYWPETLDRVARNGKGERLERYVAARRVWFDCYVFPMEGENSRRVACISKDVTERVRLMTELRESQYLLDVFFSQNLDGAYFMLMDQPLRWHDSEDQEAALSYAVEHLRITRVNQTMLELYRASDEQMRGMSWGDFYLHRAETGRETLRRLLDVGHLHFEADERRMDGTPILIEGDAICLYDDRGRIRGHFGILHDITGRRHMERQLQALASTDSLTGLWNRRHFHDQALQALRHARRYREQMSMLMLDIDHFKRVNDVRGHAAGDRAIAAVASVLRLTLRESDLLCRWGGEEFAVLLPDIRSEKAREMAERLRHCIEVKDVDYNDQRFHVTASIGVAAWHPHEAGIEPVMARADAALYQAKQSGRNRICVYGQREAGA